MLMHHESKKIININAAHGFNARVKESRLAKWSRPVHNLPRGHMLNPPVAEEAFYGLDGPYIYKSQQRFMKPSAKKN
jgi:hypothetical protein